MKEEYELYENAKRRVKQKKRLYFHFTLFLVSSVFFIILNKLLKVGEPYDWFVWAIVGWCFLFLLHFINVFITHKFMGKEWVDKQTEKLVLKQEAKIEKIKKEIEKEAKLKLESELHASELEKENQQNSTTKK